MSDLNFPGGGTNKVQREQVTPDKGPQHDPRYSPFSTAKPANVDSFGSKDARTRCFQAIDEIKKIANRAADVIDDPKERLKMVDQLDSLTTILRKSLPSK